MSLDGCNGFDPDDLIITTYNPNPHRGGWTLQRDVGVLIYHKPTGIKVGFGAHMSAHENRVSAFAELKRKVNQHYAERTLQGATITHKPENANTGGPLKFNFQQVKEDMAKGTLVCRATIEAAIDAALMLQKQCQVLSVVRHDQLVVLAGGGGGGGCANVTYFGDTGGTGLKPSQPFDGDERSKQDHNEGEA
jgi:hypothetical protein